MTPERTIRGMLYRALRRGEPVKLRDVARRLCARYPDEFDEGMAEQMVNRVARDYLARTRLRT